MELSGNVSVDGIDTVDKMWQRNEVLLKLDDYASAERNLLKITEAHPEDHRAWWMLAKLFAENKMIERVDHRIKDIVSADPSVDDCLSISRNVIEGEIITPLNYYMRNALRVVPEDSSGALRKDCQQLIKWVDDTLRDRWKVHKQKLTQSLDSYESRERTGRQEEKKSAVVSLGYRFLTVLVIAVIGFFFLLVPVTLLKIHPLGFLVGIAIMVYVAKVVWNKWKDILGQGSERRREQSHEVGSSVFSSIKAARELETVDKLYSFCLESLDKYFKT